jgi:hypothetical protein
VLLHSFWWITKQHLTLEIYWTLGRWVGKLLERVSLFFQSTFFSHNLYCKNLSENQRKAFRHRQENKDATAKKRKHGGAAMTQEQLEKLGKCYRPLFSKLAAEAQLIFSIPITASIGFRFSLKHVEFEERVQNVLEYKATNGHVKIPWSFKKYNHLGQWWSVSCRIFFKFHLVMHVVISRSGSFCTSISLPCIFNNSYIIKKRYHDGKLQEDRVAKLNSIEGWDWTMRGRKKDSDKNNSPANNTDSSTHGGIMYM